MRKRRTAIFVLILAAAVVGAAVSIALAVAKAHGSSPPEGVRIETGVATLRNLRAPQLVFRNAIPDKTFGHVAYAPLSNPDAHRTITKLVCDRVYYAAGRGLCLKAATAFSSSYRAEIFDADFHVLKSFSIPGIPSRARISRDGRFGAVTTFVNGDSYAPGNFSTRTTIVNLRTSAALGDLEKWTVSRDGEPFKRRDFNFWGITFASDKHIYATLGSGPDTYLLDGDVPTKTFRVLAEHVECPSISPDGTRIAFKHSVNSHGSWRLYVMDVKTLERHALAEAADVDDQAEWLDNEHVLYWRAGDIWKVRADGKGKPVLLVRQASSPTVVR
jgi:hypothetical protein